MSLCVQKVLFFIDNLSMSQKLGLVDRFFFGTGLLNRFRFRTGLSEPVPFLIRFIQTGFYLGNRFKVNKKKYQ